ncbi:MAG: DUF488 domain-containing protein [Thermoguttaceae bacterium]|jgi:uncharacterized protein (DUF488 family)|nr:DUF488 domain-containing protein [Thermoguttaceae bacterium]
MSEMEVFTIGFTRKTAERFFHLLRSSGAKRIVDVRLNNVSQLAGFAKRDDLTFFAREICDMDYVHVPDLAPSKDILDAFKKNGGDWEKYAEEFLRLLEERQVEKSVPKEVIDRGCLLCSEDKPDHCHRRLVAEYLRDKWNDELTIRHLV